MDPEGAEIVAVAVPCGKIRIESPAVLALRVRSLLVEVNAMGSLIGVTPAEAATYKCL